MNGRRKKTMYCGRGFAAVFSEKTMFGERKPFAAKTMT